MKDDDRSKLVDEVVAVGEVEEELGQLEGFFNAQSGSALDRSELGAKVRVASAKGDAGS